MKKILTPLLLLFSVLAFSQAEFVPDQFYYSSVKPTFPHFRLKVEDASTLAYWGEKGLACDDLVTSLKLELALNQEKIKFQEDVMANFKQAQEEYRNMVSAAVARSTESETNLAVSKAWGEEWKKKAKAREQTLWAIGGAAAAVLGGILFLK